MSNSKALNRIESLFDAHSFVEMNANVVARSTDFNCDAKRESNDGVICGHGLVDDRLVFVYSQDSETLNGTIGEMHAKKISAVYDMALKVGAPVVGFIDCGGVRLMESMDSVEYLGLVLRNASESSGVIPQFSAIVGSCGGGLSVLPALSDFVAMSDDAKYFVNSPDTIKDNYTDKCDTSSAQYQFEAGNVDVIGSEDEIINAIRDAIMLIPSNNVDDSNEIDCEDDLNRAFSGSISDMLNYAKELSDNGVFLEFKGGHAKSVKCGLIRLNGATVGFVGNELKDDKALLCGCAAEKIADFVNFCDAFSMPLVFAVNNEGYKQTFETEKSFASKAAKLTLALCNASVPKVTILVDKVVGTPYLFLNSGAVSADVVFAYPNVDYSLMKPELAAKIIADENGDDVALVASKYTETHCGVMNAAKRGYVDRIIEPVDTRKYVIAELEMLYAKNDFCAFKKHSSK